MKEIEAKLYKDVSLQTIFFIGQALLAFLIAVCIQILVEVNAVIILSISVILIPVYFIIIKMHLKEIDIIERDFLYKLIIASLHNRDYQLLNYYRFQYPIKTIFIAFDVVEQNPRYSMEQIKFIGPKKLLDALYLLFKNNNVNSFNLSDKESVRLIELAVSTLAQTELHKNNEE